MYSRSLEAISPPSWCRDNNLPSDLPGYIVHVDVHEFRSANNLPGGLGRITSGGLGPCLGRTVSTKFSTAVPLGDTRELATCTVAFRKYNLSK